MSFAGLPSQILIALIQAALLVVVLTRVLRVDRQAGTVAAAALAVGGTMALGGLIADVALLGVLVGGASSGSMNPMLVAVPMMLLQMIPPLGNAVALAGLLFAIHSVTRRLREPTDPAPAP